MYTCPICGGYIPTHNICGVCPHCRGGGFKELKRLKEKAKKIPYRGSR